MTLDKFKILIDRQGERFGPYNLEQANSMLVSGQLRPSDLAWVEGSISWVPLRTIDGIVRVPEPPPSPSASQARILPVFLLAFFLGPFGIHRFYVGKTGTGLAQLLITVLTLGFGVLITGPWSLIDWIMAVSGNFTDKDGNKITQWT